MRTRVRLSTVLAKRPVLLSLTALGLLTLPLSAADIPARKPHLPLKQLAAEVRERAAAEYGELDLLYKGLHAQPELSFQEEKTAARLAGELKALGFTVREKLGGHGLAGVFRNGPGPTVMIRTEMDALPIIEKTGLP